MKEIEHKIILIEAKPIDLMDLDYVRETDLGPQKVFKLRFGIPFYLKDTKGVIEMHSYTTTDCTNLKELGIYFREKRVFIEKPRSFAEQKLIEKNK